MSHRGRTFHLQRDRDISGVSGTGVIATGTVYPDGQVTLWWPPPLSSISVWPSLQTMLDVHGHEGATRLIWQTPDTRPSDDPT